MSDREPDKEEVERFRCTCGPKCEWKGRAFPNSRQISTHLIGAILRGRRKGTVDRLGTIARVVSSLQMDNIRIACVQQFGPEAPGLSPRIALRGRRQKPKEAPTKIGTCDESTDPTKGGALDAKEEDDFKKEGPYKDALWEADVADASMKLRSPLSTRQPIARKKKKSIHALSKEVAHKQRAQEMDTFLKEFLPESSRRVSSRGKHADERQRKGRLGAGADKKKGTDIPKRGRSRVREEPMSELLTNSFNFGRKPFGHPKADSRTSSSRRSAASASSRRTRRRFKASLKSKRSHVSAKPFRTTTSSTSRKTRKARLSFASKTSRITSTKNLDRSAATTSKLKMPKTGDSSGSGVIGAPKRKRRRHSSAQPFGELFGRKVGGRRQPANDELSDVSMATPPPNDARSRASSKPTRSSRRQDTDGRTTRSPSQSSQRQERSPLSRRSSPRSCRPPRSRRSSRSRHSSRSRRSVRSRRAPGSPRRSEGAGRRERRSHSRQRAGAGGRREEGGHRRERGERRRSERQRGRSQRRSRSHSRSRSRSRRGQGGGGGDRQPDGRRRRQASESRPRSKEQVEVESHNDSDIQVETRLQRERRLRLKAQEEVRALREKVRGSVDGNQTTKLLLELVCQMSTDRSEQMQILAELVNGGNGNVGAFLADQTGDSTWLTSGRKDAILVEDPTLIEVSNDDALVRVNKEPTINFFARIAKMDKANAKLSDELMTILTDRRKPKEMRNFIELRLDATSESSKAGVAMSRLGVMAGLELVKTAETKKIGLAVLFATRRMQHCFQTVHNALFDYNAEGLSMSKDALVQNRHDAKQWHASYPGIETCSDKKAQSYFSKPYSHYLALEEERKKKAGRTGGKGKGRGRGYKQSAAHFGPVPYTKNHNHAPHQGMGRGRGRGRGRGSHWQ